MPGESRLGQPRRRVAWGDSSQGAWPKFRFVGTFGEVARFARRLKYPAGLLPGQAVARCPPGGSEGMRRDESRRPNEKGAPGWEAGESHFMDGGRASIQMHTNASIQMVAQVELNGGSNNMIVLRRKSHR